MRKMEDEQDQRGVARSAGMYSYSTNQCHGNAPHISTIVHLWSPETSLIVKGCRTSTFHILVDYLCHPIWCQCLLGRSVRPRRGCGW